MHIQRTHFALAIACLIVLTGVVLWHGHKASAAEPEERFQPAATIRVTRSRIAERITVAGEFKAWQEVDLHAKVAGYVSKMNVDVGDRVKHGEELAVLEVPELSAQLTGAAATTRRSEQAIRRAESEVNLAKSTHEAAHFAYERLKKASATRPGLIAEQELDDALAKDRETEAQVSAADAALSEARQQLDVSKASHQQLSAEAEYTRIVAPFSGVVTQRYADPGALIQAGTNSATQSMPVVKVADTSVMRLTVPVPESAIGAIRVGDLATVHVPNLNCVFNGKIARFSDSLDPQTRTMFTEIDVPNPDGDLVVGMYATVDLKTHARSSALVLPTAAVSRDGNGAKVWVLDANNQIQQRDVSLGIIGEKTLEIASGLSDGDLVVIGNRSQFRPGQRVEPHPFVDPTTGGE